MFTKTQKKFPPYELRNSKVKDSPTPKKNGIKSTPRKRTKKHVDNSNMKIDSWLRSGSSKLEINKGKKKTENAATKKEMKRQNKSVVQSIHDKHVREKFGVLVPSFEQILAKRAKYAKHEEQVNILKKMMEDEPSTESPARPRKHKSTVKIIDCLHLTRQQLDEAFVRNVQTLKGIIERKTYSKRHDLYHSRNQSINERSELTSSHSSIVLSPEQKSHLIDLMSQEFDPENKMTTYFFQVLLPELCLRIFMDEYGMKRETAEKYLAKMPVKDFFI